MLGKGLDEVCEPHSGDSGAAGLGVAATKATNALGYLRGDRAQVDIDPVAPPDGEIDVTPCRVGVIPDPYSGLADIPEQVRDGAQRVPSGFNVGYASIRGRAGGQLLPQHSDALGLLQRQLGDVRDLVGAGEA